MHLAMPLWNHHMENEQKMSLLQQTIGEDGHLLRLPHQLQSMKWVLDLQSHDPRPELAAMAQWAQGLGAPTASTADMEQPVLTGPLTLTTNERIMEAGQLIDSTLPFKYDVNETHRD